MRPVRRSRPARKAFPATQKSKPRRPHLPTIATPDEKLRIRRSLDEAQRRLEDEVERANRAAAISVERHTVAQHAASNVDELMLASLQVSEDGIERYLSSLTERDLHLSSVRDRRNLASERLRTERPEWVQMLDRVLEVIAERGHSHRTRWRSNVLSLLQRSREDTLRLHGESAVSRTLHKLARDINVLSAEQMRVAVRAVITAAGDIDADFGARQRDAVAAADHLTEAVAKHKQSIRSDVRRTVGLKHDIGRRLEESMEVVHEARVTGELRTQAAAWAALSSSRVDWDDGGPNAALYMQLEDLTRITITKDNEAVACGRYQKLLTACSRRGAWQAALRLYAAMVRRRLPCTPTTYRLMITACKRARPSCEAGRCVEVLREMIRCGHQPSTEVFNMVLDACGIAAQWRRAAAAMSLMGEQGVTPNTATYEVLVRGCARIPLDESPLLYDGYKLAGVPESIAYACARSCRGKMLGPNKRWLKSSDSM